MVSDKWWADARHQQIFEIDRVYIPLYIRVRGSNQSIQAQGGGLNAPKQRLGTGASVGGGGVSAQSIAWNLKTKEKRR